ncbi:hypothetical protein AMAG_08757 [Allomyces macrogynus ATCC 38327]|uniref:Uncharacterized protein n=1 Tax=Allomyces macrogynus (strain ATCC 38327) TaxID=578462 RepID=A0A0L0SMQ2_ALLM3|nr:hypothetical protein AMAG_08757 [Allomyces macrogynus ATCC 38327]|eukprot:KNE63654.1 hypothetical protein AMAG_08757 [Allomyces macrogynus ATCC 38327]
MAMRRAVSLQHGLAAVARGDAPPPPPPSSSITRSASFHPSARSASFHPASRSGARSRRASVNVALGQGARSNSPPPPTATSPPLVATARSRQPSAAASLADTLVDALTSNEHGGPAAVGPRWHGVLSADLATFDEWARIAVGVAAVLAVHQVMQVVPFPGIVATIALVLRLVGSVVRAAISEKRADAEMNGGHAREASTVSLLPSMMDAKLNATPNETVESDKEHGGNGNTVTIAPEVREKLTKMVGMVMAGAFEALEVLAWTRAVTFGNVLGLVLGKIAFTGIELANHLHATLLLTFLGIAWGTGLLPTAHDSVVAASIASLVALLARRLLTSPFLTTTRPSSTARTLIAAGITVLFATWRDWPSFDLEYLVSAPIAALLAFTTLSLHPTPTFHFPPTTTTANDAPWLATASGPTRTRYTRGRLARHALVHLVHDFSAIFTSTTLLAASRIPPAWLGLYATLAFQVFVFLRVALWPPMPAAAETAAVGAAAYFDREAAAGQSPGVGRMVGRGKSWRAVVRKYAWVGAAGVALVVIGSAVEDVRLTRGVLGGAAAADEWTRAAKPWASIEDGEVMHVVLVPDSRVADVQAVSRKESGVDRRLVQVPAISADIDLPRAHRRSQPAYGVRAAHLAAAVLPTSGTSGIPLTTRAFLHTLYHGVLRAWVPARNASAPHAVELALTRAPTVAWVLVSTADVAWVPAQVAAAVDGLHPNKAWYVRFEEGAVALSRPAAELVAAAANYECAGVDRIEMCAVEILRIARAEVPDGTKVVDPPAVAGPMSDSDSTASTSKGPTDQQLPVLLGSSGPDSDSPGASARPSVLGRVARSWATIQTPRVSASRPRAVAVRLGRDPTAHARAYARSAARTPGPLLHRTLALPHGVEYVHGASVRIGGAAYWIVDAASDAVVVYARGDDEGEGEDEIVMGSPAGGAGGPHAVVVTCGAGAARRGASVWRMCQ